MEKLLNEKLLEERKLRELQNEAETYRPTEDKVSAWYSHLRQCCVVIYLSTKLCDIIPKTWNLIKVPVVTKSDHIF